MRIAIVAREFPPRSGGIGEVAKMLTDGLSARGHECTVIVDRRHAFKNDLARVVSVDASGPDPFFHLQFALNTARFLGAHSDAFDVISLHFPECLYLPLFMKDRILDRAFATVH